MWSPQLQALADFRVLIFSYPGHGLSKPAPGINSVALLADAVMALVDESGAQEFSMVGLSLGGDIALHLASTMPSRIRRLVTANCRFYQTPELRKQWDERIALVRANGIGAIVDPSLERWLGQDFRHRHPEQTAAIRSMLQSVAVEGYVNCAAAVRDFDARAAAPKITVPTLVVSGSHDMAAPPEHMDELAKMLPNARHEILPSAHLSNVECAAQFNSLLLDFIQCR